MGKIQVMDPRGENPIVTTNKSFRYSKKKDGTAIIYGIESDLINSGAETVIIPKYVDGYRVTGIGAAYSDQQFNVKKLVIPEWIDKIENFTFKWDIKLETLEIYNPHLTIEGNPFYRCKNLKEISFPNGHPYLEFRDGALLDWSTEKLIWYSTANTQTEYTVPAGIKVIGSYAFAFNESLESLVISEGVTTLNDAAVCNCYNLQKVDLPESMKSIGSCAFCDCYSLNGEIYLSPNISNIGSYPGHANATILVVKDSYAEDYMKFFDRSYDYAKNVSGVRAAAETPTPEPKHSGLNLTKIFAMTDRMQATINERDAKGEFVGYLVWRRNTNHAELIQSREEAGDFIMIEQVKKPKDHCIWQYDLKSVQWGMTREQIIATAGDEPMPDSRFMAYYSNLYGYSCSVSFDFRDNGTLKYMHFNIDPKPGQSQEDLSREILREVEQKLHAKGKKDKEMLIIQGKKTAAWILLSNKDESIALALLPHSIT